VFVRTGYHTQVSEISGKLNRKKISFHMGHINFAADIDHGIYPRLLRAGLRRPSEPNVAGRYLEDKV
jgi:hypothetical protein